MLVIDPLTTSQGSTVRSHLGRNILTSSSAERAAPARTGTVVGLLAGLLMAWGPTGEAAAKPNVLFILTDDQTVSLADQMPNLKSLVAGKGATFTHAYY